MTKLNKQGFSMIELLVVLLIIGILAAVAAPFFLQNADKSRASEAVAGAGSIRSAERTYFSQNSAYLEVDNGTTYFGTATGNSSAVLGVQIHAVKYFSPAAYTVVVGGAFSSIPAGSGIVTAQDFVITVNGANSIALTSGSATDNGAADPNDVAKIEVQMDNAGQTIYSTDGGNTWAKY